jgi:hypothetical protein
MQWYVCLVSISALAVLGWLVFELLGRPVRTFCELRRKILVQMRVLGNLPLPKPREMAVSSRQIREYDQAVRNVRQARRVFRDLGFRLLAFAENEPATHNALGLLGFNVVVAGGKLIKLAEAYPRPDTDRTKLQNQIKRALGVTDAVATAPRQRPQRETEIEFWNKSIYARDIALS